ncbi:cupredoxin domain-containing protein [Sterolibacterium denitrificans]|nr:cupredoxin domain-containing protein [Sterolibacterium denitrificans]
MKRIFRSTSAACALLLMAGSGWAAELPTFKVLMKDGRIHPETVVVPANTRFRLEISNAGPGAAEFESIELKKELVLAPGVTRKMVFYPLKPGTYKFFDDFHPGTGQALILAK